jgi:hypothetical protein
MPKGEERDDEGEEEDGGDVHVSGGRGDGSTG